MSFQGCDNEAALSHISSFRLGSTTMQSSNSAMRIRDIHLGLDVTGTYLQHQYFIILNLFYHVHCNAGGDDIRLVGDAGDASSSFPLMNSTGQHMLKGIGRARSLCLINR